MTTWIRRPRVVLAIALIAALVAAGFLAVAVTERIGRTIVVGYFDNSTGLFEGDDVRIRGVNVGKVDKIEPEAQRTKITFWFGSDYKVPENVNAVILSPQLVTGRAIQLTPAYVDGPTLGPGPRSHRTAPQSRSSGMTCAHSWSG